MTDNDDKHVEAPAYVERSAYAALEAHTVLLTDQLRAARAERDDATRARDLETGAAHRAERERDEAREQLGAAYQQRTRLADRADRLAEQALAAQHVAEQEQARAVFAIEQRDRLEQERDQLAKRVAELAEQVTTPAVMVDGDLLARLTAERDAALREAAALREQRDDARKAARQGDRYLERALDAERALTLVVERADKAHADLTHVLDVAWRAAGQPHLEAPF